MIESGEVSLDNDEMCKIECILRQLGMVALKIVGRKRMIDSTFIFWKIFEAMDIKCKNNFNVTIEKFIKFEKWWVKALDVIRNDPKYTFVVYYCDVFYHLLR